MKVLLAQPRGFCAGVTRAIAIVERALEIYGAPIYVRHEIVHNRTVVNGLRERGAVFVDHLSEVPEGATVVFRRMVCRALFLKKLSVVDSAFLMRRVRSLPKCIVKSLVCAKKTVRS